MHALFLVPLHNTFVCHRMLIKTDLVVMTSVCTNVCVCSCWFSFTVLELVKITVVTLLVAVGYEKIHTEENFKWYESKARVWYVITNSVFFFLYPLRNNISPTTQSCVAKMVTVCFTQRLRYISSFDASAGDVIWKFALDDVTTMEYEKR